MPTRRNFLQMTGAGLVLLSQSSLSMNILNSLAKDPLLKYDGIGLASLVKSGEITPKELVEASIRRIEALDGQLNAVVVRGFEQALKRAETITPEGPFAGVPFLLKDNIDYEGMPATHGSVFFKEHAVATPPSRLVKAYDAAGLNVLGNTHSPEYGLKPTTESVSFGATCNPWKLNHSTGGSSGGAAAAVAAGYVPFAHAADGGGSIRIPASCCGLFGLKPSRARFVAARGNSVGLIQDHCVSRSVRDSAQLFALSQDRSSSAAFKPIEYITSPGKRRLKIGLSMANYFGEAPHADVKAAIEQTARLCESLGHEIILVDNPINGQEFEDYFRALFVVRLSAVKEKIETATGKPVSETGLMEPFTQDFIKYAKPLQDGSFDKAKQYFQDLGEEIKELMEPFDLLLTPVLQSPPVELGYLHDVTVDYETMSRRIFDYLSYTPVQNALGMPAMSVPLGMSKKGLPIGSHFVAREGDERTLYELAYELESAQPWKNKWAPFSAGAR